MENKQEKRFNVRLELGMVISVDVEAKSEQEAEDSAVQILKEKLYVLGHDGKMFCEVDDPDTYVNSYGISVIETEEADYN